MGRQKKIKTVQEEHTPEVIMSEADIMETTQQEIDVARLELEKLKQQIQEEKKSLKAARNREITPDEEVLIDKQLTMGHEKTTLKAKIERQKAIDSQMVTGRFMNRRAPGQGVKLPYIKYDTDPVKWYLFEDGKTYTIPRGFADQLNGGTDDNPCYYTPHFTQKMGDMNPDEPTSAIHSVDTSNKKYAFVATTY